ncbi:hypothetical protein Tco_0277343 [Tanacetum coccineum]|uniref:Uncharacterized protein n=1 Tax=Tanacetum coccineum TaxID=301880 RepID=A0ABQ5J261_9ASTR
MQKTCPSSTQNIVQGISFLASKKGKCNVIIMNPRLATKDFEDFNRVEPSATTKQSWTKPDNRIQVAFRKYNHTTVDSISEHLPEAEEEAVAKKFMLLCKKMCLTQTLKAMQEDQNLNGSNSEKYMCLLLTKPDTG